VAKVAVVTACSSSGWRRPRITMMMRANPMSKVKTSSSM